MRWWERSVGGRVRGRIIALLRRGERTVEELARSLELTDNAVRAHLATLERDGVVHQARLRHTGGVGKPAALYAIAPAAEPLFSTAYAPVLRALLAALERRMSNAELDALFRDVGRKLAAAEGAAAGKRRPNKPLEARVNDAARVLTALGSEIDVERTSDAFILRGHACPLSDAVRAQPRVCHAVTQLVSETAGVAVKECCERSADPAGPVRCCFEVRRSA
jgi:predicted ArsR family transcriptional regulator